jgi:hypothetical protein
MNKELNVIDNTSAIEHSDVINTLDILELDELVLALVGGGIGAVDLG